jgi:hypothetical protein
MSTDVEPSFRRSINAGVLSHPKTDSAARLALPDQLLVCRSGLMILHTRKRVTTIKSALYAASRLPFLLKSLRFLRFELSPTVHRQTHSGSSEPLSWGIRAGSPRKQQGVQSNGSRALKP